MSNQDNQEVYALKQEIAALRDGIDKRFIDKDTQAEKQVLREMRREANTLIQNSDEFELVRETRSAPVAIKLIERTYKKTGEVLTPREALKLVENELFKDTQKVLKLKKIQGSFAPQMNTQQRYSGMRTLTNRDTANVPMSAKQRAMAAFYGTYKR